MPTLPPYVELVLAPNAGPMTLEGTNCWVLRGDDGVVLIDPGPAEPEHLRRLSSYGKVLLVLLTHGHADHSAAAELFGCPVAARDPLLCRHSEPLRDDDLLSMHGLPPLRVLATPGHTEDSACFAVDRALLTGDTLLGRGSTMVADPAGRLADYLASLHRIALWAGDSGVLLPGHGPCGGNVAERVAAAMAHRLDRLDQVRRSLAAGAVTAEQVVADVYTDVDRALWPAAEATVRAQLAYLSE